MGVYAVLRIALGRALKMGKVTRNVCTLLDPPARARREPRPLSRAELAAFLKGIETDRFAALYIAACGTGLRQGELLALRWQDVDLERGLVSVRHTLQRGSRSLAEPKTDRATHATPAEQGAGRPHPTSGTSGNRVAHGSYLHHRSRDGAR